MGVVRGLALTVQAIGKNDQRAAQSVVRLKDEIRELAEKLSEHQAQQLRADDPNYFAATRLQMSFVDKLRHIYTLSKRIARTNLPQEVAIEPA